MSNSSDYHKKWEQEHKEQQRQYKKKWEQEHREHRRQYKKKWKEENQSKKTSDIICPYYISETAMQITCESVNVNEKYAVHKFKSKELKDKHRNCFCESFKYKQCMHNWEI